MKTFLVFCVVAFQAINAHNVKLSDKQKEKVQKYSLECMTQTGVKPELLMEAKKGNFADDEALKKFTLCLLQKIGIVSSDGKWNNDVALSKLPAGVDKTAVGKVLEECKKKTGKDAAETAFEVFKCYHKATPTHIVF